MQEQQIIQGAVCAVIYQNYDNGYAVLRLETDREQTVTVVGTIPMPAVGERLMVTGKWSNHSSYGRQFEAEFLERLMPQTEGEILKYLSSRILKGIGPAIARRIVDKFKEKTLVIMERQPERLAEVTGISLEKAKAIGEEFRLRVGMRQLMEFFAQHQLPADLAVRTYKRFGESAVDYLYDEPYLLMEEGLDAPFGAVDRFAIAIGVPGEDARRIRAGIFFELNFNLSEGHSFLPQEKLIEATAQLLTVSAGKVAEILEELIREEMLVRQTLVGLQVIYLQRLYEAECYIAARLLSAASCVYPPPGNMKQLLQRSERECGIRYSAQQEQAVCQAATESVLLLTGGPGTGKTTVLKGMLSFFEAMGLRCVLAAPTGRAAKRLTEVTGAEASTIHRLLEATIDPTTGNMVFARDENNPLKADVIIVDEMSMVDVLLLHDLLRAIPPGKRMIFVGDPDQLPPVGPGFPFWDCLRSEVLPSVHLTEIFRQARESLIVMNAHRVNQGQMPELHRKDADFFFLPCRSEEEVAQTISGLCRHRLPEKMGIASEQIQVVCPTRRGGVGTVALNQVLQTALNPAAPGKKERIFGDLFFREGDRVMQIRNNYDILWKKTDGSAFGTGIFNGDIGVITRIDPQEETFCVVYDDREAIYDFAQMNELEKAYAVTVHKSQGSEYRAVILCAWNGSSYLLNRSVLYTAITRARELLIVVGRQETVAAMVENAKRLRRYTGLKLRLQGKAPWD